MQDQLTGGQTNLQQPRSDLQPTNSNLQQGSTPSTSSDTTNILNQPPPTTQLKVQSSSTRASAPTREINQPDNSNDFLLLLLIFPVLLAIAIFWPRKKPAPYVEPFVQPLEPVATVPQKVKSKKKKSKRKKSSKR